MTPPPACQSVRKRSGPGTVKFRSSCLLVVIRFCTVGVGGGVVVGGLGGWVWGSGLLSSLLPPLPSPPLLLPSPPLSDAWLHVVLNLNLHGGQR